MVGARLAHVGTVGSSAAQAGAPCYTHACVIAPIAGWAQWLLSAGRIPACGGCPPKVACARANHSSRAQKPEYPVELEMRRPIPNRCTTRQPEEDTHPTPDGTLWPIEP